MATRLALRLMDCSPCALTNLLVGQKFALEQRQAIADFSFDVIAGGVMAGGAAETLVPFRLLDVLHEAYESTAAVSCGKGRGSLWNTLPKYDQFVILVEPSDIPRLIRKFPRYKRVCLCVPSGPLCSRMLFNKNLEDFYAEDFNPAVSALADAGGYRCIAWLRSSLTCRYEGLYVPAIRVAETAARLLSSDVLGEDGGCCCERVVFEEGICGLTPRWLETTMKTTASCGVPISRVILAVCSREGENVGENYVLSKAIEVGISTVAVTAMSVPIFASAEVLTGIDDAITFVVGWNDAGGEPASVGDVEIVDNCVEYCALVGKRLKSWIPTVEADRCP